MIRILLFLFAFSAVGGCAHPAPSSDPALAATARLKDPIPPDPAIHTGTFANGLTWFAKQNGEPEHRLVLRLVVKVGSIVEDDDQLGIAHLVEHMAFNGTTHFPHNDVIHLLESFGAKFGPHINASTSFNETVYKLTVPTDDPAIIDQAFLVLEDWAHGQTDDPEEIAKERGVVLEEWRRSQGAGFRVQQRLLPLEDGPQYASRLPIGTEDSLLHFDPAVVSRFYRDWYRPDLMSVIAVGDVDVAALEGKIADHFGALTNPPHERKRPWTPIPAVSGRRVAVVTDPELTRTSVSLSREFAEVEGRDHAHARENAVERMMTSIMSERFADRERAADRPFLGAWARSQRFSALDMTHEVGAATREGGAMTGLEAVLTEWARVKAHGFNASELERARKEQLAGWDDLVARKGHLDSTDKATELVRVFTQGEFYADLDYEAAMMRRYINDVSLEEVSAYAKGFLDGDSQLVEVVLPAKDGTTVPTEQEVAALVDRVLASSPEALPDTAAAGPLVANEPTGGTITTEERPYPVLGFVHWTLSNGVAVWFKSADFTPDTVQITAFSPGGAWLAPASDWFAASTAVPIATESGFGEFSAVELGRRLAGQRVTLHPWIGGQYEGFQGQSSREDLPTLFQLLWLEATAPRFDEAAFERVKGDHRNAIAQRDAEPETAFTDALTHVIWSDELHYRAWKLDDLAGLDLAKSRAFYQERFADLSDLTLVVVGDTDDATLRPLLEKWAASLPSTGRVEHAPDIGARRSPGQQAVTVTAGAEPKAHVRISYYGTFDNDFLHRNRLLATADVLNVLLREDLREARSGVYGVSASSSSEEFPTQTYEIDVDFVCDPARVDELTGAALSIAEKMRTEAVDPHYIEDEKAKNRREREVQLRDDGFWVSSMVNVLENGEDPAEIARWNERNDSLTPDVVRDAASAYLDPANRKVITRLPAP